MTRWEYLVSIHDCSSLSWVQEAQRFTRRDLNPKAGEAIGWASRA